MLMRNSLLHITAVHDFWVSQINFGKVGNYDISSRNDPLPVHQVICTYGTKSVWFSEYDYFIIYGRASTNCT